MNHPNPIALRTGIRQHRAQFLLLVLITAFIGSMVGMERPLIPQLAQSVFGLTSKTAMFSFIVAFGISKALSNLVTGRLSDRWGRKRLLVAGWLFALPVPWILMYADHWNWIIAGNILLGIKQGACWSSTQVMKLDLASGRERGLAMGVNEFAGYFAVGMVTLLVSWIAGTYGLRPYPFYAGVLFSLLGLLLSLFFTKDTRHLRVAEAAQPADSFGERPAARSPVPVITQAGTVNNMNDGMLWGLYPLVLAAKGFTIAEAGAIIALYPACWGIGQLFTGRLGDLLPKKHLLFAGMTLQAATLAALPFVEERAVFVGLSVALGIGKALVYPNFLAAIDESTAPTRRARAIGTFRFCRDMGYALGAILTGTVADAFGTEPAILLVAGVTLASAVLIALLNSKVKTQKSKSLHVEPSSHL
ncbi:MFS transporter [Flaviaesturariibacter amylovorans]|uniref:MFS transporter n=1 Tax=Flaviaesturariibacter amylovorans TaxID=1084520 RepID=A0ABP8H879_9BACT